MSDNVERSVTMVLSEDTARNLARDLYTIRNPDPTTVSVHADLIRLFPDTPRPYVYRSTHFMGGTKR